MSELRKLKFRDWGLYGSLNGQHTSAVTSDTVRKYFILLALTNVPSIPVSR